MENKLKSVTLVDQLEEKLLQYIKDSNLKDGDSLPSELFFAEKYSVSRNLVRESLSRLKMLNLIESRRKRGIIIKEPDPMANFVKVVNPSFLSEESILDLIELRFALEIGIAPLIFRNITKDDILDLEQIISSEQRIKKVKVGIDDEINFHTRIYQIVNNDALLTFQNVIIPIFSYVYSNFKTFNKFNENLRKQKKLITHKDLLDKLRGGDQDGYAKSIENHLGAYIDYVHENRKLKKE